MFGIFLLQMGVIDALDHDSSILLTRVSRVASATSRLFLRPETSLAVALVKWALSQPVFGRLK